MRMKKKSEKQEIVVTSRTHPDKVLEKFKDVFEKGGSINYKTKNKHIYAIGQQPNTILCKLEKGKHYTYQRDKKCWVEI